MKRYDVTEDDLEHLIDMARDYGEERSPINAACLSQAYAACTKVEIDPAMNFKHLHQVALSLIEGLMDLNPSPGTPECKLLENLAAAVDLYEREKGMGAIGG